MALNSQSSRLSLLLISCPPGLLSDATCILFRDGTCAYYMSTMSSIKPFLHWWTFGLCLIQTMMQLTSLEKFKQIHDVIEPICSKGHSEHLLRWNLNEAWDSVNLLTMDNYRMLPSQRKRGKQAKDARPFCVLPGHCTALIDSFTKQKGWFFSKVTPKGWWDVSASKNGHRVSLTSRLIAQNAL